ncbi:hypothetical protein ELG83_03360 [Rhizobium leguminosarum]|uniref:Uncharacterized protein n=1 Tax=Rhizobium leguminosarum bv. viciae TaxID=387 RepID=A0A8G2IXH9_RHILV|nr:hypothetical protein [Rhizobium leguminosarum bv. viciae]TBF34327.1 hypothetical protein ELG88_03365 [Rhizobium leguminosarum]NKK24020.1 hypothetical protein [Rhizobium leguminosarum bv. viciae]NKK53201.1 hypothetical protein [Rhizobium leguminosarum bv. viciae]TBF39161.1 hypothetical protein ELG92_03355 [Rhizobium leguminosarum]
MDELQQAGLGQGAVRRSAEALLGKEDTAGVGIGKQIRHGPIIIRKIFLATRYRPISTARFALSSSSIPRVEALLSGWRQWLPLTLTLSPPAGRGDVPCERLVGNGEVAAWSLRPASGEKVAAAG